MVRAIPPGEGPFPAPVLPPLVEECQPCEGHGVVTEPAWSAWWAEEKRLRDAWYASHPGGDWLASPEYRAHDMLAPATDAEEIDCHTCRGAGNVPTEADLAILALVRDHGGSQ